MKKLITTLLIASTFSLISIGCGRKVTKDITTTEKPNTINTIETSSTVEDKKEITEKEAIEKVKIAIGDIADGFVLEYDHMDKKEGNTYYVIHFFEKVIDNKETGESHQATVAWYYVDKNTGDVFEWDLIEDKLKKLS